MINLFETTEQRELRLLCAKWYDYAAIIVGSEEETLRFAGFLANTVWRRPAALTCFVKHGVPMYHLTLIELSQALKLHRDEVKERADWMKDRRLIRLKWDDTYAMQSNGAKIPEYWMVKP